MKILFLGHNAASSGAQILLFQLLQWIKKNHSEIEFEILLGEGGILLKDYSKLSELKVFSNYSDKNKIRNKIKRFFLIRYFEKKKFDLIYCNSIVNGTIINLLGKLDVPIICHVHELDYWINKAGEQNLNNIKNNVTWYIAASYAVKNSLINNFSLPKERIDTIYEFLDIDGLENKKQSLRSKLNLSKDSIIIGASGAEIWRKGKDWFIPLATDVLSRNIELDIHFVWIGGDLTYELEHDFKHCKFNQNIHFIKHLISARDFFHEFHAFAMLSREDPFPVVNLEAACVGVPIVCFENAGGTNELVSQGCGYSVPYGDLHEFANKISLLIQNKELKNQLGVRATEIVKEIYDINIIGSQIIEIIKRVSSKI